MPILFVSRWRALLSCVGLPVSFEILIQYGEREGHSRKVGFPGFRSVHVGRERLELCLVGLFLQFPSHRRSGTGEVSLSIRSHVACVLNHRKIKYFEPASPKNGDTNEQQMVTPTLVV